MESKIVSAALSQGVWASLSVVLIFYILKNQERRDQKQEEREEKYREIINKLTDKLNIIKILHEDVKEIKNIISFKK